jgi:hypothetical protein
VRGAFRAIKTQLRAIVGAIFADFEPRPSRSKREPQFPARALISDATQHWQNAFRRQLKMSPKRAHPPENSSRQSKKRKITAARSISVQRRESGSIPDRPSKSNGTDGQY